MYLHPLEIDIMMQLPCIDSLWPEGHLYVSWIDASFGRYNMQALKQKCHCPAKLVAVEVVKMTISSAHCEENFIKITTVSFQWVHIIFSQWWFHVNHNHKTVFHGNSAAIECFGINCWMLNVSAATVLTYFSVSCRYVAQIPKIHHFHILQCTGLISLNAPFCCRMVLCGIFIQCIVGFMKLVSVPKWLNIWVSAGHSHHRKTRIGLDICEN